MDGLYFALPTRAAASQIHRRVTAFMRNLFPGDAGPEPLLAVPGYLRAGDATGKRLPDYDVWWDDHPDVLTEKRRWAAASTKRYLAAQIAVGTVDQAMMAVLQVRHAHMRAACLARNLLVVDEVHASDTYMSTVLEHLLRAHIEAGGYAVLMSATLGSAARCRWLGQKNVPSLAEAIDKTPYPAVSTPKGITAAAENGYAKTVSIAARAAISDFSDTARLALQTARAGAKVLVIRNTVGYAVRDPSGPGGVSRPRGRRASVQRQRRQDAASWPFRGRRPAAAGWCSGGFTGQEPPNRRPHRGGARRHWNNHWTLTPTC